MKIIIYLNLTEAWFSYCYDQNTYHKKPELLPWSFRFLFKTGLTRLVIIYKQNLKQTFSSDFDEIGILCFRQIFSMIKIRFMNVFQFIPVIKYPFTKFCIMTHFTKIRSINYWLNASAAVASVRFSSILTV